MSAWGRGKGRRTSKRLTRSSGTRPQIPVFHLYVEGEVTEVEYFRALGRREDLCEKVVIKIEKSGGQPELLVDRAVKDAERAN